MIVDKEIAILRYKDMKTYEHHVFLRANGDRCGSVVGFDCESAERLSLKPAIDFRLLAARARAASSVSCIGSDGEPAWEHVFMCACAVATCSNLVDKLLLQRASHIAHRPSSIRVLVRPISPRRGH